jgi:hypothetical protein
MNVGVSMPCEQRQKIKFHSIVKASISSSSSSCTERRALDEAAAREVIHLGHNLLISRHVESEAGKGRTTIKHSLDNPATAALMCHIKS